MSAKSVLHHEDSKKINIVDRLSRHLDKGTPAKAAVSYLQMLKKWIPSEPVIHIDDSDVVKPDGYKFESLGIVRDGSESTSSKNVYKKGYHVTEACVLTGNNHPVSIFSRWKIEEYFRCKKQMFQFENFRVRKLCAINALNFYITLCMAFLTMISMESESNALKVAIIKTADPVKEKVFFCYYRLAKGISGILSYAKEGVRLWFRTKRPAYRQLCLKLVA